MPAALTQVFHFLKFKQQQGPLSYFDVFAIKLVAYIKYSCKCSSHYLPTKNIQTSVLIVCKVHLGWLGVT